MDEEMQEAMLAQMQDEYGEVEVLEEVYSNEEEGEQDEEEEGEAEQKPLKLPEMRIENNEIYQELQEYKKKKKAKQKHTLSDVFAGMLPNKEDIVPAIPQAKLRGDDVHIMARLIKKYDDDFDAMHRDIKLNYMQWSKGQLKTKYKSYFAHGTDKVLEHEQV